MYIHKWSNRSSKDPSIKIYNTILEAGKRCDWCEICSGNNTEGMWSIFQSNSWVFIYAYLSESWHVTTQAGCFIIMIEEFIPSNKEDPHPRLGTKNYQAARLRVAKENPNLFRGLTQPGFSLLIGNLSKWLSGSTALCSWNVLMLLHKGLEWNSLKHFEAKSDSHDPGLVGSSPSHFNAKKETQASLDILVPKCASSNTPILQYSNTQSHPMADPRCLFRSVQACECLLEAFSILGLLVLGDETPAEDPNLTWQKHTGYRDV